MGFFAVMVLGLVELPNADQTVFCYAAGDTCQGGLVITTLGACCDNTRLDGGYSYRTYSEGCLRCPIGKQQ